MLARFILNKVDDSFLKSKSRKNAKGRRWNENGFGSSGA